MYVCTYVHHIITRGANASTDSTQSTHLTSPVKNIQKPKSVVRHSTRPSSSSFIHSICFCSVRDKVDTRSRALPADAPIDLWHPSSKDKISTRLYCRHALCGWHTPRFFSIVNTYQQPPFFDLAWRNSPCLSSGLGFQYEDILPNFPCLSFLECSHRWRSRFPAHTG